MGNQSKIQNPQRIVGLVDTYTFATQVLARAEGNPNWNCGPSVTALNTGRIISVNLFAKNLGINNSIRVQKALRICPSLTVFVQPTYEWGKPDQTLFRIAGHEVFRCIQNFTDKWQCPPILHWVPQDETYIDMTDQVNYLYVNNISVQSMDPEETNIRYCMAVIAVPADHRENRPKGPKWPLYKSEDVERVRNYRGKNENEEKLVIASKLISYLQKYIQNKTLFHCSAGIGPNKMMAKIACSLNPPGSLSALSKSGISKAKHSEKVPLKKLSPLTSPVKRVLEANNIETMAQLQRIELETLGRMLKSMKEAVLVKKIARGNDLTPVVERLFSKTVNCGRNYYKRILSYERLYHEVDYLVSEMEVRLQEQLAWYNRRPSRIQLAVNFVRGTAKTRTISLDLSVYNDPCYMAIILERNQLPVHCGIIRLRLAALKFE